ncbi:hypothetical protein AX774_g1953 [Zancudomyces culisetae]|uniref:Late embryogenesis abundant protein LEA-2 subgroup domain-containing protein n=1 Tax=Zancudomyces culisetae TaxID=1213189 RepID=A0A1R1PUD7_ZANCU|nr:hypothetical protein AX774_g3430 [Zancudomyces culisetae]OMH84509.1 hypothetical protein AX774_g1953 [Zancudomyces culisetae]|eukprot:OMH83060.1 hypothetical protein AX774_g3430 [Zancudomyces culisetae]
MNKRYDNQYNVNEAGASPGDKERGKIRYKHALLIVTVMIVLGGLSALTYFYFPRTPQVQIISYHMGYANSSKGPPVIQRGSTDLSNIDRLNSDKVSVVVEVSISNPNHFGFAFNNVYLDLFFKLVNGRYIGFGSGSLPDKVNIPPRSNEVIFLNCKFDVHVSNTMFDFVVSELAKACNENKKNNMIESMYKAQVFLPITSMLQLVPIVIGNIHFQCTEFIGA